MSQSMEWRPIETAPATAEALLLCAKNGSVVIAPWPPHPGLSDEECAEMGVQPDDGWNPAAWMPVPSPPTWVSAQPLWARGKPTAPQ